MYGRHVAILWRRAGGVRAVDTVRFSLGPRWAWGGRSVLGVMDVTFVVMQTGRDQSNSAQ